MRAAWNARSIGPRDCVDLNARETRCAKQGGPSARAKSPASRTLAGQHVLVETAEARLAEPCSPRRCDRGQGCSDASAGAHETDGFVLAAQPGARTVGSDAREDSKHRGR